MSDILYDIIDILLDSDIEADFTNSDQCGLYKFYSKDDYLSGLDIIEDIVGTLSVQKYPKSLMIKVYPETVSDALINKRYEDLKSDYANNRVGKNEFVETLDLLKEYLEAPDDNNDIIEPDDLDEELVDEELLDETYSDEELHAMINKVYNQQKIVNIYRKKRYGEKRLYAHTRCQSCGREKRVFLSNLIKDPDKYGSCVCSDTNVESHMDNIQGLYSGRKKLSSNTSGYTGVYFVKNYSGKPYNKWRAYIEIDGKRTYLGDFNSKSKCIKARKAAAQKGLTWYKEHKNEFMATSRQKHKRYKKNRRSN